MLLHSAEECYDCGVPHSLCSGLGVFLNLLSSGTPKEKYQQKRKIVNDREKRENCKILREWQTYLHGSKFVSMLKVFFELG